MPDKQHRRFKIWEPLLLAGVAVIGMIAGARLSGEQGTAIRLLPITGSSEAGKLTEMIRFIEEKYVDEVNSDLLIEKAIRSIIGELDPHSSYISPEALVRLNEKMEGHFEGIGIEFHMLKDTLTILAVTGEGPAERAGLLAHDRIISADDSTLVGGVLSEELIIQQLRGPKGSELYLEVKRHGVDTLIPFTLVRDRIPIISVDVGYMLDEKTGYIKINRFSSTTYREFMEKLEGLVRNEGMEHLIIDLRQNPGGYLKESVNILSQLFSEKGLLLVYTEGEHAKRMDYKSTGKPFYEVDNIAVLIDGGSASASEIIAGGIQDQDRGVIIGTKSFGKGLVQEHYVLKNGGAFRLTTARYYTPSGRSIQRPYENGDSVAEDNTSQDSSTYRTRNGRSVYAAGGIEPDIVVPARFSWDNQDMRQLYEVILEYAFYGFSDINPKSHETIDIFVESFPEADEVLLDLLAYWQDQDPVGFDREVTVANWEQCYTLLRAMVGSYYFGREAWYKIINLDDPVTLQALQSLKQDRQTTLKF